MTVTFLVVVFLIIFALFFDFLNGFHDAANSIATVVSTRVLTPKLAVLWAAIFNFIAFLFFGTHVAKTIGKGIINVGMVKDEIYLIIFATLMGACIWNILTWYLGLPTSSSHALIGGLIGSTLAKIGHKALIWKGIAKTAAFIVISPVFGFILGILSSLLIYNIFAKTSPFKVDSLFRKGQLISAALYSLGHGGNDAQKTMGIIMALVYVDAQHTVPLWIVLSCHAAIALGTMFGGWRIVKTMGQKVTKLRPVDGFCAETSAAASLFMSTNLGIPVSTTHTITGAIMGVGSVKRFTAVRWGVAGKIITAWILTIPASSLISYLTYKIFHLF
ncbi:MAG: inorganic phosphate transporter [Candidatus Goldbacteria bacterium]|nr:inorganic phosphate transporter [Candidatus Goldiibacteriota bacterium]